MTKQEQLIKVLPYIFSLLLVVVILFEFVYFLNLKPFSYPVFPDLDQHQFDFVTDLLLERKLQKLTDEEKIGALFMVGFDGQELDKETKAFFQQHYFHNFLLLGRNISDKEQLKKLNASLLDVNTRSLHCLIAIDQEGGSVSRIKFENMDQTSQAEIVDVDQAFKIANNRGEILSNLNINMNFAPVVEIIRDKASYLSKDQRAFIGDDKQVFALSSAFISGYTDKGVISVPKHFPGGLGRENGDPHQTLPTVDISRTDLDKDLIPFEKLIKAGKTKVIMTTHLFYPQIDQESPVTLSIKFISSILRDDLGYRGLIISDDLVMRGMQGHCAQCPYKMTIEEVAKKAFLAGHDLILISGPRLAQARAYQTLLRAVKTNEISQRRLHYSLKRILRLLP